LSAANVTDNTGVFILGNNDKFLASGNVSVTNGSVTFGTTGKLAVTGDLTLNNTPVTFGTGPAFLSAADAFLSNKAKITFADSGNMAIGSILNVNNGQIKFGNTGTFSAGATTLVNSSVAGGTNITVTLGAVSMDPSTMTYGDGSQVTTGDIDITGGGISLGKNTSLTTGNILDTGANITLGSTSTMSAADVTATNGGIGIGSGGSYSGGALNLNNSTLSLGSAGNYVNFSTSGDITLVNASVLLGSGGSGSTQSVDLTTSSITIGNGSVLGILGDIAADSTALGMSTVGGAGAVDLGALTHAVNVGNGDGLNNVDLSITSNILNGAGEVMVKSGAGRLQLAPASGSSGEVDITTGDVQVDTSVGPVQLLGGTLSGNGSVGTITGSAGAAAVGIVAPGDNWTSSISGVLFSGSTVWGPQTTFSIDLSSSTPGSPTPGSDYDQLQVNGDIELGDAVLDAHYGSGIKINDVFTIITTTGQVHGKFQQFNNQDIVFVTGQKFTIEYQSDAVILHKVRADATVSMTSAPNPSTLNQPVTLVATVVPEVGSSLIPLTTTVTFYDNGTPIGTVPVDDVGGQDEGIFTTTSLTAGVHVLTVTFDGDADNFNPSNSPTSVLQTVETPIVAPLSGAPPYISPNNSPTVQDQFNLSTTVSHERSPVSWSIAIKKGATTVQTITGNGNPDVNNQIAIATSWNGRVAVVGGPGDTNSDGFADDGSYSAAITITDGFTNVFSTPTIPVVVDNTSPTANLSAPSKILIDPTGASTQPTSTVLTGTVTDTNLSTWVLDIRSGGALLREFTGAGSAVNVTWDGKYTPGNPTAAGTTPIPDAAYTITILGTDLAGNVGSSNTQTVVVLAHGPIVTLTSNTPTVYGQSFTLTATAELPAGSPASLTSLLAGDTINFFQGGTPVGTGTLALNNVTGKYQTSVTVPPENAGTYSNFQAIYPATADFPQGTSNFGTHVITPAPVTVKALDATRTYGSPNPAFDFTVTGLVNGDTKSVFTGSPATTATAASSVGAYPITQGSLAPNGNYTITTFTNGTLTITPAGLTIKIDDKSRFFGQPNPAFTYTVLGLVNGDPASVVSSVPLGTTATITSPVGSYPITATGTPIVGSNYTVTSILNGTLAITPRLTNLSIGSGPGGLAMVSVYGPDGSLKKTLTPFGSNFDGVRTVMADFNNDGVDDLAVGTGPGVIAQVTLLDGVTGANLFTTFPFEDFTGGVFVSAGDIDSDGAAELVVTPDEGGGPRVSVYEGKTFTQTLSYFGINDPNFRGGARAGVGDLNGDGFADIAVSAGFQGGPRVSLWDGKSLASHKFKNLTSDFFVFEDTLRNGAYVAIGDVNGDGFGDLIAGAGPGGGPRVKILSGADLLNPAIGPANAAPFANFFAGDINNRGGVRVAAKTFDADLNADVLTGVGDRGGDTATAYLGANLTHQDYDPYLTLDPFPGLNNNGVYVG